MKQRFVLALLTVAIAVIGSTASAIAPVISDEIPDVIISDDLTATLSTNLFVHEDAFDLAAFVSDPDQTVTPDQVIWSYYTAGNIRINDADVLDLGDFSQNPVTPDNAQRLSSGGPDDPDAVDGLNRTITLRNTLFSPVGGPNVDPHGFPGDQVYEEDVDGPEAVTLIASDGTTFGLGSIMVYTDDNGADALEGVKFNLLDMVPTADIAGVWVWTGNNVTNSATLTEDNGLCIEVPGPGSHFALWYSPFGGDLQLVQDSVYRFRIDIESATGDLPVGTTPFWSFLIDNFNENDIANSEGKYSGDFLNQDTQGGANSLRSDVGRSQFDIYYAPSAINAADWNDPVAGEFIAAKDAVNDMKLTFRVLDIDGPIAAALDLGNLCLRNVLVDRAHKSLFTVASEVWSEDQVNLDNFTFTSIFDNSTLFDVDGTDDATLSPWLFGQRGTNAWLVEVININPGDNNVDFGTPSTVTDNWPIAWESDKLLKGIVEIEAPNNAGEAGPPDAIALNFDSATTELLYGSVIYSGANSLGLPKNNTPNNYEAYFYTQNASLTTTAEFNALRLNMQILNNPAVRGGGTDSNLGGVQINAFTVQELNLPDEF